MRILVTGAAGQLGSEVVAELERRALTGARGHGIEVIATDRSRLDVADRDSVLSAVASIEPDVIVHPAAWTAVDDCELDPDRAFRVNALGARHVAEAARRVGAHLAHVSTDYVFDGTSTRPYVEWDQPNPMSVYGRAKLGGEQEVAAAGIGATIVRTSWVCGRHGPNMVKTVLRLLAGDGTLRFVDDQHGSPTIASDLAVTLVDLALARRPGLFHVTNSGATTWYGLARAVAEEAGADPSRIEPIATGELDLPRPAPRPLNSVLDNAALRLQGIALLPDWRESLGRLVLELTR